MSRYLPLLIGLTALLAAGLVHGLWTNRWERSRDLAEAVERMAALPADLGEWKGTAREQDAETLALAGAVGHWTREFTREKTGEVILVMLLCGRPGQMAVHRPEHCYRAAGFEMTLDPVRCSLKPSGPIQEFGPADGWPETPMWTGLFRKDEADGPIQQRIFWTWFDGEHWDAPNNPRWTFANKQALYKLYVIRGVSVERGPLAQDPCVTFMELLLPELNRCLDRTGRFRAGLDSRGHGDQQSGATTSPRENGANQLRENSIP